MSISRSGALHSADVRVLTSTNTSQSPSHATMSISPPPCGGRQLRAATMNPFARRYLCARSSPYRPVSRSMLCRRPSAIRYRGANGFKLELHGLSADQIAEIELPELAEARKSIHQKLEAQPSPES